MRVAMSRNATRFIRPILFQSLTGHAVYLDEFKAKKGEVQHVELARETDLFVVAPATANIIGKFAAGIANDFMCTFFLACRCPILIAPAMNVYMYRNPIVSGNIQTLRTNGVFFVEPEEGYLACGDEGPGRLAPVEEIVEKALSILVKSHSLKDKHVVVTAGPTWERLDPVRILTNRSSGKMGYAIAEEAAMRGARVTLISGPTSILPPTNVSLNRVESAKEMNDAVLEAFDSADYLLKTAAVSDFQASAVLPQKRKKTGKSETLELVPTDDILLTVAKKKTKQIVAGFCAETENLEENAGRKLKEKNLDFIVANLVGGKDDPFQSDENAVLVLDRLGGKTHFPLQQKKHLASRIWDLIIERTKEIRRQPVAAT